MRTKKQKQKWDFITCCCNTKMQITDETLDRLLEQPQFISKLLRRAVSHPPKVKRSDYSFFLKNLKWMLPHLWQSRNWDYTYTTNLLIDSLNNLADGLKGGHALLSEQQYRRCKTAARKLGKAIEGFYCLNDNSYKNWSTRHTDYFEKRTSGPLEGSVWRHEYLKENAMGMDKEEYSNKMWNIVYKRCKAAEEADYKEAWAYLAKHLRHFWD